MYVRVLCTIAALHLLAACGGDGVPLDGSTRDAGEGDTGPGAVTCERDRDCDDMQFCNGREVCRPADMAADARGCVSQGNPCLADQSCNEVMGRCESDCDSDPDADGDGYAAANCGGVDCDDSDGAIHPGRTEVCDDLGVDEDCDPSTLSGPAETDVDSDGYVSVSCCNRQPTGAVRCGLDCDDEQRAANPAQPETCDEIDNDCDDAVDERVRNTFYRDADGDLYGDDGDTVEACMQPSGYTANGGDCDDSRSSANPGGMETCDGLDEDCDTRVDEEVSPRPDTAEHCGGCGLVCPAGYLCAGTECVDEPVRLTAGSTSTCALTAAGDVYCWGGNREGEVGTGSSVAVVPIPTRVTLPAPALDVAIISKSTDFSMDAYEVVTCAALTDGSLWCWGTGLGSSPVASAFSALPSGTNALAGAVVSEPTLYALTMAGSVSLHERTGSSWVMTAIGPAAAVTGLCGRRSGGTMACQGPSGGVVTYPEVDGGTLQSASESSCATRADGALFCWGRNGRNQVGPGASVISTPTRISGLPALPLTSVSTRSEYLFFGIGRPPGESGHTCVTVNDGRAYCWGANSRGELGVGGASAPSATPARVATTQRFTAVEVGLFHTCALSDTSEVWCWGANDGRLGTADVSDAHAPVRLPGFPVRVPPTGP